MPQQGSTPLAGSFASPFRASLRRPHSMVLRLREKCRAASLRAVVLFPIALVWLVFVVLWAVRQTVEPSDGPWRPWRQRRRTPRDGPHGHPARGGAAARRAHARAARTLARR